MSETRTVEQIERARARWRKAKAVQRARQRGLTVPTSAPRPPRGPVTPVLRVSGDWRQRSACKTEDPKVFDAENPADSEAAQKICKGCPVRAECLEFAVRCGTDCGVWGGVDLGRTVSAVAS